MKESERIINEFNKCSPAATNANGIISVYLGTESIGIIIANAISLQCENERLMREINNLNKETK